MMPRSLGLNDNLELMTAEAENAQLRNLPLNSLEEINFTLAPFILRGIL